MCARYSLTKTDSSFGELFGVEAPALPSRWNVAPSQTVPVIVEGPKGVRRVELRRWGLVPPWAKDPSIGARMINARAEEAASKPSFRAAMKRSRCLVPADGFYEWRKEGKSRLPVHFRLPGQQLFAFAGLCEVWTKGPAPLETVAILTTSPNASVAPVHDRMPVILPREAWAAWLDPGLTDAATLAPFLGPCADELVAVPLSTFVNDPRHEGPACWEAPPREDEPGLFDGGGDAPADRPSRS